MKVFISWSGERSKAVAILLSDWIKCVIQATRPWISTRDIDRGALWFTEIGDQLRDTTVGIVCLTNENKNKPWILFETGALAKGLSSNRVCTFLVDLNPTDLEDPLAQFNHTTPTQESMWELVRTLNNSIAENRLDERILEQVFSTYWGEFDKKFKDLMKSLPKLEKTEPRTEKNLLSEILENTRYLSKRISSLEVKVESEYDQLLNKNDENKKMVNFIKNVPSVTKLLQLGLPIDYIKDQLMKEGHTAESAMTRIKNAKIANGLIRPNKSGLLD